MAEKTIRPDPLPDAEEETLRRFVGGIGEQVRNSDLLCVRCVHLWKDAAAECGIYSQKPLDVLRGGNNCPEFTPSETIEGGDEKNGE